MKVQRRIGALKQRQGLQGEGSRARGLGCSGPAQEGATSQVTTVGESASKNLSELALRTLELERGEHIVHFKSDPATLRMGFSMSAVAFALEYRSQHTTGSVVACLQRIRIRAIPVTDERQA